MGTASTFRLSFLLCLGMLICSIGKLLLAGAEEYSPEPKRLPLVRRPYDTQSRLQCSAREMAAPLVFEFICTTDLPMESYCWTMPWDDTPSYPHRALARTCRLVCRAWARQLPLGDSRLTVTDGVAWYGTDGEWQVLPRTCWAWTFQRIEWWVERSEQDHVRGRYRDMCGAWYPKASISESS